MQIEIKMTEAQVKELIASHIAQKLGDLPFDKSKVLIETKSKQNYRSEWESADFRVTYSTTTS